MALVINATNEDITIQVAGNYFNWKPGQRKTIRNASIARYIEMDRKGYGLAVLPDLTSQEEDDGDVEVTDAQMKERKALRVAQEKIVLEEALNAYVARKREVIRNAQVSLAMDLSAKNDKQNPKTLYSQGELEAMRLVVKYGKQGKDAAQKRVDEIEELEKKLETE